MHNLVNNDFQSVLSRISILYFILFYFIFRVMDHQVKEISNYHNPTAVFDLKKVRVVYDST